MNIFGVPEGAPKFFQLLFYQLTKIKIRQKLLIVTTEKVAQITDIDSINIKRSMLGDKVTLSEMANIRKEEIHIRYACRAVTTPKVSRWCRL